MTDADDLAWAESQARYLRGVAEPMPGIDRRASDVRPIAAAALDFLSRHAPATQFEQTAMATLIPGKDSFGKAALQGLAGLLDSWVEYVRSGMADALPPAARARVDAATDLMEQVQLLLDDGAVHAAAPVMLAGAALEEMLRSITIQHGVSVTGRPGIQSYANSLRTADVLTAQQVKDITAWAGQRNEAAHGEFGKLSRARAQLMVDGINLFMQTAVTNP